MAPTQVRNDSSQPDVLAHKTDNAADKHEAPRTPEDSGRGDNRSQVRQPRQAADPSVCQSFHRLKFDSNDYYRNIPTRKQLIDGGYSAYSDQQAAKPLTRDKKRKNLEKIAQTTREQLTISKNLLPNIHKTPRKSILKRWFPDRSNKGQPGPSSDASSAKLQLNMYDTHKKDSIDLPPNIHISEGDFFIKPDANFGHYVCSDLAMSAGIATQFRHIFPKLTQTRQTHQSLSPGSLVA